MSAEMDLALDRIPIGAYQIRVAVLCGVIAMLDGFDTQAAAFIAPVLGKLWAIGPEHFALIFAASLVGIMLGQITLGPLADKYGRRPVVLLCTVWFALGSLATALADDWVTLLTLRFVTGIGLGGATPNIIALTAEFAPPRARSTMITTMFAGFPLGAAIGGYISSLMIPVLGWQSVFVLGGIVPLVLLVVLLVALPESPHFLSSNGRHGDQLARILKRLFPAGAAPDLRPASQAAASHATDVAAATPQLSIRAGLFGTGRSTMTLLLWLAYFNSLLMIYFLMNWLPTVVRQGGLALDTAIISSVFLNLGGALGGILLGRLSDNFGAFKVLALGYAVAGVSLVLIGQASQATTLLMTLAFVAGLTTIGGQTAMNAAATTLYPAAVRATALGAALAVGRVGSILGPAVGGLLLASQWSIPAVFIAVAVPALITSATAVLLIRYRGANAAE